MKKLNYLAAALLFLTLLPSRSYSQVKSDYDKNADFTKIKTYNFAGWQKDSDKQLNDFDKKRILESLKAEFDKRGMTLTEGEADVSIALYLVLDQKQSTTAYTDYMGGMGYGARWGWGMGAGMGSATTTYSQDDYVEGTLVVDMYDDAEKKLLWQGVLTQVVKDSPQKREKSIPKAISKLMKKFPIQ